MHKVGLLVTFLWDSCIAGKSQQVFKLGDNKLYTRTIVNSFDKYISININNTLLFKHFFFALNLTTNLF